MNILQRIQAPTPKFFKVLRTIGLSLVAAGGVLVASPIALPLSIVTLGSYLVVAGTVATAVSQVTVKNEPTEKEGK